MEDAPSEDEEEEEEAGSEKEEEEEKPSKKSKGKEVKPGKQEDGSFKRAPKPNPFKAAIEKREAEKKAIQEARDVSSCFHIFIFQLYAPPPASILTYYSSREYHSVLNAQEPMPRRDVIPTTPTAKRRHKRCARRPPVDSP